MLNLEGFGIPQDHAALGPAGALVLYVTENLCAKPENLHRLQLHRSAATLLLDPATLRNLEIFTSTRGERNGSLLSAINRTHTAPGARLLETWLAAPPQDLAEIRRRSNAVGALLAAPGPLAELRHALTQVRDIPRILGRLQNRLRNPANSAASATPCGSCPGCVPPWRLSPPSAPSPPNLETSRLCA